MRRLTVHLVVALQFLVAPAAIAVAQPAPPVPAIAIDNNRITVERSTSVSTDIVFEIGEATIKKSALPLLDAIAKVLATSKGTFSIDVHSDDTAPDSDRSGAYVLKLTQQRAEAIKKRFTQRGVAANRLVARGIGSRNPLSDNATDDGRRMNRRFEIVTELPIRPPVAADLPTYSRRIGGRGNKLVATIATSNGKLTCELFADKAPMTVANFIGLATGAKPWTDPKTKNVVRNRPFYDGLTFHRIIPEFMIQGGDPTGTGMGGPGYTFGDETQNGIKHTAGSLAMANAGPGTNGSQFYVSEVAAPHLDGKHTVFGLCQELDVIAEIARLPKDAQNRPTTPVTIKKVTIQKQP